MVGLRLCAASHLGLLTISMGSSGYSEISEDCNLDRTKRILPELVIVAIGAAAFRFDNAEGWSSRLTLRIA